MAADRVCTRYNDDDGIDIGCHLVTKEYMLEAYPSLVPWMKAPGLWMWGFANDGRLGDNSLINKSSPVQTASCGTNWRSVSAGAQHSAAIKSDGTLWLWGLGIGGRLGDNTNAVSQSSPVQTLSGGNNWKNVSVGADHTAAIKTDGTLWLWGVNTNGNLGRNSIISASSPVQTISGGTNWQSVSIGSFHSAGIKTDSTLWVWGLGTNGRLGTNDVISRSSPVQTISAGTDWKQVNLGTQHSAAIKGDGTLWLWGYNGAGRLGTNNIVDASSPVQTISGGTNWRSASIGGYHSAAIKTDGSLWAWGNNTNGRVGDGTATNRSSPVQTIIGGNNWRSLSAGTSHTAAIKADGTLWLWGGNACGQLGINSVVNQSIPIQTISEGNNWRNVSAGNFHTAAIRDEGDL